MGALVTPSKRDPVGLASAAEALETELRRFEELAEALGRERLDSEKNLRRAAQGLVALRDVDARLAEHLATLVTAIGVARERQESSATAVRDRAELIRQRSEALTELMQRWEALGQEAADVTRITQQATSPPDGANGDEQPAEVGTVFACVDERLGSLAESAQSLADAAQQVEFQDLARQADGLRMQVLAARNKLRLARSPGGKT
jgi:DNA repair exonuclease SbcCD ATPase subunit